MEGTTEEGLQTVIINSTFNELRNEEEIGEEMRYDMKNQVGSKVQFLRGKCLLILQVEKSQRTMRG